MVRSKVEHVFAVMKLKFGFVKLRFRGLQKNATQLFAVCALVNLYLARKAQQQGHDAGMAGGISRPQTRRQQTSGVALED